MPAPEPSGKLCDISPFPIGTVIKFPNIQNNTVYRSRAVEQFSCFTPEKSLKASFIQPQEGVFSWTESDGFVDLALQHKKKIHGHTLIWDHELPEWMLQKSNQQALLCSHISNLVQRYRSKIGSWDVVNEAFTEEGAVKQGAWFRVAGPDYIRQAFACAAAADPAALLFYNDFDLETNPVKRKAVLNYLNDLRNQGIKVDGIGLQMHLNISSARPAEFAEVFEDISREGYLVHISELDISVIPFEGEVSGKEELFMKQAKILQFLVEAYLHVPPPQRFGITFWGVGDADSWLALDLNRVDFPLLFDENYLPKPAWYGLYDLLRGI